jgi:hypothetical protein
MWESLFFGNLKIWKIKYSVFDNLKKRAMWESPLKIHWYEISKKLELWKCAKYYISQFLETL